MIIGAQLYMVRDFAKDLDCFSETLKILLKPGFMFLRKSPRV